MNIGNKKKRKSMEPFIANRKKNQNKIVRPGRYLDDYTIDSMELE